MSKILIIEDDENILDLEKDYIEASEMHADGATDGNTAVSYTHLTLPTNSRV